MDQKEFREFYRTIQDVAEHPVVLRMKKYPHHGDTSCYKHYMTGIRMPERPVSDCMDLLMPRRHIRMQERYSA